MKKQKIIILLLIVIVLLIFTLSNTFDIEINRTLNESFLYPLKFGELEYDISEVIEKAESEGYNFKMIKDENNNIFMNVSKIIRIKENKISKLNFIIEGGHKVHVGNVPTFSPSEEIKLNIARKLILEEFEKLGINHKGRIKFYEGESRSGGSVFNV